MGRSLLDWPNGTVLVDSKTPSVTAEISKARTELIDRLQQERLLHLHWSHWLLSVSFSLHVEVTLDKGLQASQLAFPENTVLHQPAVHFLKRRWVDCV